MNVKLRSYLLLMCFLFSGSIMAQQGVLDTTFNTDDDGLQEMVLTVQLGL
jgi:hypothetical protein